LRTFSETKYSGPNWIHGTKNNPIADIAEQSQTRICGWDGEEVLINKNGEVIDPNEAEEYAEILWDDGIIAEAFRLSKENQDSIDPERSFYDFIKDKVDDYFTEEPAEEAYRKRELLLLVAQTWGAYVGSPVQRQSLRFFWLEECIEGENPFVAETYHKILATVAASALKRADIRLRTPVTAVGTPIEGQKADGDMAKPRVKTADGSVMEFDEVVVTVPLGWLKRNTDTFRPSLPPRLGQAIDNIGYGTLDKVYITFPSAFWNVPLGEPSENHPGLDPDGTTPNVTATTAPLHQPDETTQPGYTAFTHWISPAYASETNPEAWDQEAMNLAALPGDCAHPTLLFYIYGPCSKHIADTVTSASSESERDAEIVRFFQPYYSMLPNYDEANPDCTPRAVLATAWAKDEFAGYGSYSNFQVGLEDGARDIEVMRHGVPERHLWFAGEHTAPFESSGTTTGAYVSGEAVARRIVDARRTPSVIALPAQWCCCEEVNE
jgi:hypothetical protein